MAFSVHAHYMQGSTLPKWKTRWSHGHSHLEFITYEKGTHAQFHHHTPNHLAKPPHGNPSPCCLHPFPSRTEKPPWEKSTRVQMTLSHRERWGSQGLPKRFWLLHRITWLHSCFPDPFSQFSFYPKQNKLFVLGITSFPASLGTSSINFPFIYTFLYLQSFLLDLSNQHINFFRCPL